MKWIYLFFLLLWSQLLLGHGKEKHEPKIIESSDHSEKVSEQKWTEGIVRRIDSAEEKITIKHGEIRNVGIPPITMTFQVKDFVLLHDLKLRDEIRFQVTDLGEGEFRVEALEIIKPYSQDNHSQKINSSKSKNIDQKDPNLSLELLTIDIFKKEQNFEIIMLFSENRIITLSAEVIEVTLEDQKLENDKTN